VSMSWFKNLVEHVSGRTKDPAAVARAAQLREFKAAVARGLDGDRATLDTLLQMPTSMGLPDDEVELEVEAVQGALDLLALRDAVAREGLPVVEHQHKALATERCHFLASAFLANDGGDRTGRLFLTHRRLVFVSSPMIALSWSGIAVINQNARDLIVVPVAKETLYQFRCNSFSDARRGAFIAQLLKRGNNGTGADAPRAPQ
jgi:hypothetical protein